MARDLGWALHEAALMIPERCFKLLINGSSVDAIEDEKLVFRLFR
jgi:hypothetical protein